MKRPLKSSPPNQPQVRPRQQALTIRTSKHTAHKTGKYRSGAEARFAANLESRGVPFDYETVHLAYTVHRKYIPDFVLKGKQFFVEFKGWFKSSDRTKLLAVREANPTADVRLVFQNPNARLSRKSKTTYAQWADKHGFLWAARTLPEEWLKESKND